MYGCLFASCFLHLLMPQTVSLRDVVFNVRVDGVDRTRELWPHFSSRAETNSFSNETSRLMSRRAAPGPAIHFERWGKKCLLHLAGVHKARRFAELVFVKDELQLTCYYCRDAHADRLKGMMWFRIGRGHFQDLARGYPVKEVPIDMHDVESLNRVTVTADHTLVIRRAQLDDAGSYFCQDTNSMTLQHIRGSHVDRVMDSEDNFKVLYHVDVVPAQRDKLRTVKATGGDYGRPFPLKRLEDKNLKIFTQWQKWGDCEACGQRSERRRIGLCTVSKLSPDVPLTSWHVEEMLLFYPEGLPCRSAMLADVPEIITRPDEVELDGCVVPCNASGGDTVLNAFHSERTVSASTRNIRKTIVKEIGQETRLFCPGAHLDTPVAWAHGSRYLSPLEIHRHSHGRIKVDLTFALHISHLKHDDAGIYSCWYHGKKKAEFVLEVTGDLDKDAIWLNVTYLLMSFILDFIIFLTILIIRHRNRPTQQKIAYSLASSEPSSDTSSTESETLSDSSSETSSSDPRAKSKSTGKNSKKKYSGISITSKAKPKEEKMAPQRNKLSVKFLAKSLVRVKSGTSSSGSSSSSTSDWSSSSTDSGDKKTNTSTDVGPKKSSKEENTGKTDLKEPTASASSSSSSSQSSTASVKQSSLEADKVTKDSEKTSDIPGSSSSNLDICKESSSQTISLTSSSEQDESSGFPTIAVHKSSSVTAPKQQPSFGEGRNRRSSGDGSEEVASSTSSSSETTTVLQPTSTFIKSSQHENLQLKQTKSASLSDITSQSSTKSSGSPSSGNETQISKPFSKEQVKGIGVERKHIDVSSSATSSSNYSDKHSSSENERKSVSSLSLRQSFDSAEQSGDTLNSSDDETERNFFSTITGERIMKVIKPSITGDEIKKRLKAPFGDLSKRVSEAVAPLTQKAKPSPQTTQPEGQSSTTPVPPPKDQRKIGSHTSLNASADFQEPDSDEHDSDKVEEEKNVFRNITRERILKGIKPRITGEDLKKRLQSPFDSLSKRVSEAMSAIPRPTKPSTQTTQPGDEAQQDDETAATPKDERTSQTSGKTALDSGQVDGPQISSEDVPKSQPEQNFFSSITRERIMKKIKPSITGEEIKGRLKSPIEDLSKRATAAISPLIQPQKPSQSTPKSYQEEQMPSESSTTPAPLLRERRPKESLGPSKATETTIPFRLPASSGSSKQKSLHLPSSLSPIPSVEHVPSSANLKPEPTTKLLPVASNIASSSGKAVGLPSANQVSLSGSGHLHIHAQRRGPESPASRLDQSQPVPVSNLQDQSSRSTLFYSLDSLPGQHDRTSSDTLYYSFDTLPEQARHSNLPRQSSGGTLYYPSYPPSASARAGEQRDVPVSHFHVENESSGGTLYHSTTDVPFDVRDAESTFRYRYRNRHQQHSNAGGTPYHSASPSTFHNNRNDSR